MRIMIMVSSLVYGGCETQVIATVKGLISKNIDVFLYFLENRVPRLSELQDEITSGKLEYFIGNKAHMLDLQAIKDIRRNVIRWQPDLVHSFLFHSDIYSRFALLGLKIPLINSERNHEYRLKSRQLLLHYLTRFRADAVIANTHAGAKFAATRYRLPESSIYVVWNGIDIDSINAKASDDSIDIKREYFGQENIKLATMVASIKPQKNHALALDVATELISMDPTWRVLFVGGAIEGSKDSHCNTIIAKYSRLKNSQNIRLTPNTDKVISIIKQSDVFFLTSKHEGFPNVIMEAMTLGVPIASTNYSDIKMIEPLKNYIVDNFDAVEMACTIHRAYDDRQLCEEIFPKWVAENVSLDLMIEKLIFIYQSTINRCVG